MKILIAAVNAKYVHTSLSIRSLCEYAKEHTEPDRFNFVTREYTINQEEREVLADLYEEDADVCAFSVYIWNIGFIINVVQMLKKVRPNTIIVLGGPEVSYNAEEVLNQSLYVDFVIKGAGEVSFVAFLQALNDKDYEIIRRLPGLAGRCNDCHRENVFNNAVCVVQDKGILDNIPFPYRTEKVADLKGKILYYEASRGCPFSCSYCISGREDEVLQFRNVEKVKKELMVLVAAGAKQVKFVDRTFNIDKCFCMEIWHFLAELDGEIATNFHFEVVAELLDDTMLDFLQTVQKERFQFEIGIQTTCPQTLAAIRRSDNYQRVSDVIRKLGQGKNIHLHLDLIVALPYESDYKMCKSFDDVYALEPGMLQLGFLKMLHGSAIRDESDQHGYIYNCNSPYEVLQNNYMSFAELEKWRKVEQLLEMYYNKHRCIKTIEYLIRSEYYNSPSAFYRAFVEYWSQKKLFQVSHKPVALYEILWEYCCTVFTERCCERCRALLRFDACAEGYGKEVGGVLRNRVELSFVKEQSWFWRNDEVVGNYVPGYKFTSWRQIHGSFMLELFDYDMQEYFQNGVWTKKLQIILFAKEEEKILFVSDNDGVVLTNEHR